MQLSAWDRQAAVGIPAWQTSSEALGDGGPTSPQSTVESQVLEATARAMTAELRVSTMMKRTKAMHSDVTNEPMK